MIRALITDDNDTSRSLIHAILDSDPEIQVVGLARDGWEAVKLTQQLRPSVVTMDIQMPRMDGFQATKEIMVTAPTPIVIVTSSPTYRDVETSMRALAAGALTVMLKPHGPDSPHFEDDARLLLQQVKAMADVKVVAHRSRVPTEAAHPAKTAPPRAAKRKRPGGRRAEIVAIGTSTGGPAALAQLLTGLPADFPAPILVVQHITAGFTQGLVNWLNTISPLTVTIAKAASLLKPGVVYVAPDNEHLLVANRTCVALSQAAPIGGFRPSATMLFQSVAEVFGGAAVAAIMTGMGDDGVEGLRAVHAADGHVLAQDRQSSVIFGMPAAAIAAGVVDETLPLEGLAPRLIELV